MKPSPEIEKCPWCHRKAKLYGESYVACDNRDCWVSGPRRIGRPADAIRAWNRVSRLAKRSTRGKGK